MLFGSPARVASSPTDGGWTASTTLQRSCAARSIAWVPVGSLAISQIVERVFHGDCGGNSASGQFGCSGEPHGFALTLPPRSRGEHERKRIDTGPP